nr:ABC transporter substrate-binding protein [Rhodobacter kunshanensis]
MQGAFAQNRAEISVGYFYEWPMPFQYARVKGIYEEEMGVKINWVKFDTGAAMSAAMAADAIQIAVSQGGPTFAVATSAGQDLNMVDIAVSYSENEGCVIREELGIDKSNAAELVGKRVAVPLGNAAHYSFLSQLEHVGVNVADMIVVDMAPAEGAAALSQGSIDMACGWGGAFERMKEHGDVLMTGAEKEAAGILIFDATTTTESFATEDSELLARFLEVTAEANTMWNSGDHITEMLPVIAKDAGMDEEDAAQALSRMDFPTITEQLSPKWFGGGVQKYLTKVAAIFAEAGSIPKALPSYDHTINTGPLEAAGEI